MDMYGGLKVIVSAEALDTIWNWPYRQRSKRLMKKMTKKYGPQITLKPRAYKMGKTLIVHPSIYAEMKRASDNASDGLLFPLVR